MKKLLGICGPSGSGKTTLASGLRERLGRDAVSIHSQDAYYRDLGHLPHDARNRMNFDHPGALDWDLLEEHLAALKQGRPVEEPVYDFHEHVRRGSRQAHPGVDLLIVDGHLLFSTDRVLHLIDFTVYLDADLDLLFIRRLLRDTAERGRGVASVCSQYLETVRPMLFEHVAPAKAKADLVLATDRDHEAVLEAVLAAVAGRFGLDPSRPRPGGGA